MSTDATSRLPGRPTKLTPELQEKICGYIAQGNYLVTACQAVGISKSCYLDWIERAEVEAQNGGGIFYDFMLAIKRAEAEAEIALASVIGETALTKREWLPAITFLERRHPDRWGRKDRTAITIDEHKSVTITRVTVVLPAGTTGQIVEGEVKELADEKEPGTIMDNHD